MNDIYTTICGNVATDVRHQITKGGQALTTFRLASTPWRYDQEVQGYVDGDTTWVNVSCWGGLAFNANKSLAKGQPIVVFGTLRTRDWETEDKSGRDVDISAIALGHDLRRGAAKFERVTRLSGDRQARPSPPPAPSTASDAGPDAAPGPDGPPDPEASDAAA